MHCIIKMNKTEKYSKKYMINFGRGKRFEFNYIGGKKVRVFKKGLMFILSEEEFNDLFEVLNR